jgi:hypothetical protein
MYTTNYYSVFIVVADDCPVVIAETPPQKTAAGIAFEMIKNHPYQYTSDDVLFQIHIVKNNISETDWNAEKQKFFSKGQVCLRASALVKRYGWGIHFNAESKVALCALESEEYKKFSQDKSLKIIKAMRSKHG